MEEEYLIKKWLANELTADEKSAFEALDQAGFYSELIETAKGFKAKDESVIPPFQTFEKHLPQKNDSAGTSHLLRYISAAAAIALLFFLGYSYFNGDGINTYATDIAENRSIVLPDRSTVKLNESSKISFDDETWNKIRRIQLEGEAYFEVEKGNPFQVITPKGQIEVLGTSFNVNTKDSIFTVVCYEGLVQVLIDDDKFMLPAGKSFSWNYDKGRVEATYIQEPSWLNDRTVFKAAPLKAVFTALEDQYDITVDYPQDIELLFTGAFAHDDLTKALDMVTGPLSLTYTMDTKTRVRVRYVE